MFDLTIDARIANLTMNRPAARNSIPADGWRALTETLGRLEGARVLILRATGAAFCAGADFGDLAMLAGDEAAAGRFRQDMNAATHALRSLPIPTIAAIDGGCFGAGVALALACDIRIAGSRASFGIPPAKLGITYPFDDIARLVALVGPGQAARLLLGAMPIAVPEAARIGLIEQAVTVAGEAAEALARTIAANSPASLAGLKALIARTGRPADADTDALFDRSFLGEDFAEGIAAMQAKRPPAFE